MVLPMMAPFIISRFTIGTINEPRREKTGFLHMRKQRRRSASLISAFVFAIWIVESLYYLNPKFQACSHLLWLYSPVCVGPGRKSRRPVFSERGSNVNGNYRTQNFCLFGLLLYVHIKHLRSCWDSYPIYTVPGQAIRRVVYQY